jgi:CHASE3 domain sensor protein
MNDNRSVFSLDGITGMLIATVLLLTILAGLSVWGLNVQNASATNFYEVKDEQSIKMLGSKVEDHIVDVGSK